MVGLDVAAAGPDEDRWRERARTLPRWPIPRGAHVVVVAPHPDDETLGLGGTLRALALAGARLDLVAVTDGEGSHPGVARLGRRRRAELCTALDRLGVRAATRVHHLGVPDGAAVDHAATVVAAITDLASRESLVLGPHPDDGHADHDAVGRATAAGAAGIGAASWAFPVWAWHWHDPTGPLLAGAHRVPLSPADLARKRHAVAAFTSQVTDELGPAIVPDHVLRRLLRDDEVLIPCA